MKSVTKYLPSKMEPVSVNQLVDIIFFWFMLEPVPLLNIFIYFLNSNGTGSKSAFINV